MVGLGGRWAGSTGSRRADASNRGYPGGLRSPGVTIGGEAGGQLPRRPSGREPVAPRCVQTQPHRRVRRRAPTAPALKPRPSLLVPNHQNGVPVDQNIRCPSGEQAPPVFPTLTPRTPSFSTVRSPPSTGPSAAGDGPPPTRIRSQPSRNVRVIVVAQIRAEESKLVGHLSGVTRDLERRARLRGMLPK